MLMTTARHGLRRKACNSSKRSNRNMKPVAPRLLRLCAMLLGACAMSAIAIPPQFPAGSVWRRDISQAPLADDSASMIRTLQSLGGWGSGDDFQIDFAITILHAAPDAPTKPVVAGPKGYYEGECDEPGFAFPLPPGGAIEQSAGYRCNDGDCHLLVVQGERLYESYLTNVTKTGVESMCAIVWQLDKVYPAVGRGDHCTSADAAGFPIAPLLLEADDVAAAVAANGELGHALRFILPNARMATGVFVRPASHAGGPSGPPGSLPYGSRLRLRADFPMAGYNAAAKAILRTMQRYGIVLADGGNIALTAADDRFSRAQWSQLGINAQTFTEDEPGADVRVTDFVIIDSGPRISSSGDCERLSAG